ncbi:MAG: DNA-binding CsgD family transcriptional regulator [Arenicella sp.]
MIMETTFYISIMSLGGFTLTHFLDDLTELLGNTLNLQHFWEATSNINLQKYGASSMFYGTNNSRAATREHGLLPSAWYKTNHPDSYLEGHPQFIEDDIDNLQCVIGSTPSLWNKSEAKLKAMSHAELQAHEFAVGEGLGVGITIPIPREGQCDGWSGIGLNFKNAKPKDFESFWQSERCEIVSAVRIFDRLLREKFKDEMYPLTDRQKFILSQFDIGNSAERIADKIGRTQKIVNLEVNKASEILKAKTRVHTVSKAKDLGLLRMTHTRAC